MLKDADIDNPENPDQLSDYLKFIMRPENKDTQFIFLSRDIPGKEEQQQLKNKKRVQSRLFSHLYPCLDGKDAFSKMLREYVRAPARFEGNGVQTRDVSGGGLGLYEYRFDMFVDRLDIADSAHRSIEFNHLTAVGYLRVAVRRFSREARVIGLQGVLGSQADNVTGGE